MPLISVNTLNTPPGRLGLAAPAAIAVDVAAARAEHHEQQQQQQQQPNGRQPATAAGARGIYRGGVSRAFGDERAKQLAPPPPAAHAQHVQQRNFLALNEHPHAGANADDANQGAVLWYAPAYITEILQKFMQNFYESH